MTDSMEQVLQDCLDLLGQGVPLEECIARYPEYAKDLGPLLSTADVTQQQLAQVLPAEVRNRVRARLMTEWARQHEPRRWRWPLPLAVPRWAAVAASLVVAIMVGGGGTVAAAGSAIPGDALYPVKEITEETRLWLTRSPEARVEWYSHLVKERVEELLSMTAQNRSNDMPTALRRLDRHLEGLDLLVQEEVGEQAAASSLVDEGLILELQDYVAQQRIAQDLVEDTLLEAEDEARPDLETALGTISRARERVQMALEAARPPDS